MKFSWADILSCPVDCHVMVQSAWSSTRITALLNRCWCLVYWMHLRRNDSKTTSFPWWFWDWRDLPYFQVGFFYTRIFGYSGLCMVHLTDINDALFSLPEYRLLGTPDEEAWPGVTQLPDYKNSFPQWKAKPIRTAVSGLDDVSTDLLSVSHLLWYFDAVSSACLRARKLFTIHSGCLHTIQPNEFQRNRHYNMNISEDTQMSSRQHKEADYTRRNQHSSTLFYAVCLAVIGSYNCRPLPRRSNLETALYILSYACRSTYHIAVAFLQTSDVEKFTPLKGFFRYPLCSRFPVCFIIISCSC